MQKISRDEVIQLNVIPYLEEVLVDLRENKSNADLVHCIRLLSFCLVELCDIVYRKRKK